MIDEHVPGEELAELDEDLLPPIRAAQVREHLAECAACRGQAAEIASVRRRLAALAPVTMPGDVSARITAELEAAAGGAGSDAEPSPGPNATTVIPIHAPSRRRHAPALAGVAAAVVVLAAIAAVVVGHVRHHSGRSDGTSSASGADTRPLVGTTQHQVTVHTTGRNYTPSSLPAAVPQLVTGGLPHAAATPLPAGPGQTAGSETDGTAGSAGTSTGSSGTTGSAARHAARLPAASPAAVPAALRHLYRSRAALLACAARVSDTPGAVPLTVDFARWTNGQYHAAPSVIFVFQQGPSNAVVIVTGPSCSGLDAVRDYHIVPLP